MKGDELLQQWKQAKQTCNKIIQISIASNLYGTNLGKQSGQEFMRVYDVVYRICSGEKNQTRFVMVYKDYKEMIKNALLNLTKQLRKQRQICKLKILKKIWDAFEDIIKRLKHMFAYLNRPYHLKQGKIQDLDRTGMVLMVQTFFNEECLLQFDTIYFKTLHKMRESRDYTDSLPLKDYVDILYRIHLRLLKKQNKRARTLYTDFQQKYLNESKQFYKKNYNNLKEFSPSEYFLQINDIFQRQRKLADQCFSVGSENLINKVFSREFLEEYRQKLITSPKGLKSILQNRESQTIKVITQLYKQLTNSIDGFKEPFQSFVYQEYAAILQQFRNQISLMNPKNSRTQSYITLIKSLITRSSQLIQILKTSFMKYNQFISYYRNGIERALSRNTLSPPIQEILSVFVESQMKINYQSQDQLHDVIRNILGIFQCTENKDLFLFKYLQKLCKNILVITIEGLSNHQAFINALKIHSGIGVTEKLETIIDQYKQSLQQQKNELQIMKNDKQLTFKQLTKQSKLPYMMNIRIFREGIWPFQDTVTINMNSLPDILYSGAKCIKTYEDQVMKKRMLKISLLDNRIRWVYYFQKKQLQNEIQENKKKLGSQFCYFDTNGVQAILLCYIYERRPQKIGLNLLQEMFPQIKFSILQASLKKMSQNSDTQLLIKQLNQGHVRYIFNTQMRTKKRLINYDVIGVDQMQEGNLFQSKQLGRDREFTIDANIAKLMKSKKVLTYDKLVEQVIKMIKVFVPTVKDIKTSVQKLIQKQIIIRDEKDRSIIRYKN